MADAEFVESNGAAVNNTADFPSVKQDSFDLMSSADAVFAVLVDGNMDDGCCVLFALLFPVLLLLICEKNMRRKAAAFDMFVVLAHAASALLSIALNGCGLVDGCGINGVEEMFNEDFVCGSGLSLNALLVVPRLHTDPK